MIVGILQADSVLPQYQAEHGNYPGMFEHLLSAHNVQCKHYNVEAMEYPGIDDCDGYLITGSKKSVYDDEPWIIRLSEFVRELHQRKKPTVGVCFGHQLIAHALGGRTQSAPVGWGVGIHEVQVICKESFLDPFLAQVRLIVSHKDQVTALPDGAQVIATSDFCPVAMFTVGEHMFGMQGHPEFSKSYSAEMMGHRRKILGEEKYAEGTRSLEGSLDADVVTSWIVNFLKK